MTWLIVVGDSNVEDVGIKTLVENGGKVLKKEEFREIARKFHVPEWVKKDKVTVVRVENVMESDIAKAIVSFLLRDIRVYLLPYTPLI